MQRELVAVCDRMNERFLSMENLIDTMISLLKKNGVGPGRDSRFDANTEG